MFLFTAAHNTLPLGTVLRVTNLKNGRAIVVRVNDRGPVPEGRIIDLSYAAAQILGFREGGLGRVRLQILGTSESTQARANTEARTDTQARAEIHPASLP
jgi:rare lipoprotein A